MVDMVAMAALAKRMIEAEGRPITLYKRNRTPTVPGQPWTGNTTTPGSGSAGDAVNAIACFVPAAGTGFGADAIPRPGTNLDDVDQYALIASTSLPANTDLVGFDSIDDGAHIWKIVRASELQPGSTSVLWEVGVKR